MNRQTRKILVIVGLALLLFSVIALTYALIPNQTTQLEQTLSPTLFAPPLLVTP
jgi:hypothetical protein